jgi:hypothetical protein
MAFTAMVGGGRMVGESSVLAASLCAMEGACMAATQDPAPSALGAGSPGQLPAPPAKALQASGQPVLSALMSVFW